MNPTTTTTICPEDGLIQRSAEGDVCAAAVDDGYLVPDDGSCQYLLGSGDFNAGIWSQYTCTGWVEYDEVTATTAVLPDTYMDRAGDMDPATGDPFLGVLVLIGMIIVTISLIWAVAAGVWHVLRGGIR